MTAGRVRDCQGYVWAGIVDRRRLALRRVRMRTRRNLREMTPEQRRQLFALLQRPERAS